MENTGSKPCENHEKKIILRGLGQFLRKVSKNLVDNFSLPKRKLIIK